MTVVDKDRDAAFDIAYSVMVDDTMFGYADIPLPDAKTHQFFAFAGALFPDAFGHRFDAFSPPEASSIEVPLWITTADVKRAATAGGTVEGAMLTASDIPAGATLAENAALDGTWQRIQADDERVPITIAQAQAGARWELATVEPGIYSIAAYIFSPPYNGWAVRPGVVKVIDAEHDMPAGTVESINDFVFAYQGRRIHACLDVAPGTKLDAYYAIDERPEVGWQRWVEDREVESGRLELCFHEGAAELTGSVRVRLDLRSPDGTTITLRSPDTITALNGTGECVPSDTLCCDFPAAPANAADGGSASDSGDGTADDAAHDSPPPKHADAAGGCGIAAPRRGAGVFPTTASCAAWLFSLVRARRLRFRRGCPRIHPDIN